MHAPRRPAPPKTVTERIPFRHPRRPQGVKIILRRPHLGSSRPSRRFPAARRAACRIPPVGCPDSYPPIRKSDKPIGLLPSCSASARAVRTGCTIVAGAYKARLVLPRPSSVSATCRRRTTSICEDRRSSVEVRSRPRLLFPVRAATITRPFPKPWPVRAARGARRGLREPPFVGG